MKRVAMFIAGIALAVSAMAEASFQQIEGLIEQKNYAAAAAGLEGIIQNHPKSAKAFYAMAQAQAGLGNLEKAQKALNIATGLNPTLDFAPQSSVQSLKDAITPQVSKIEVIEESHAARNFMIFLVLVVSGFAIWFAYGQVKIQREKEQAERDAEFLREEAKRQEREAKRKQEHMDMLTKQDAERKAELAAEAALKAHKNYGHERFDPANPDKLKSVKQFKEEAAEKQRLFLEAQERREAQARADAAEARGRGYYTPAQAVQPTQTVVHTSSGSNDMLTGVLIGNMLSGSHHHDTERTVVRETVREVPAPSRDSSWDDTPSRSSSRSSSWDDDSLSSSSKSSSSWSDSSSSSSSSWDSGSSSSDSSSSSSWD